MVGDDGKPQQLPWEDWREGDDEMTSGWMRATAPAGRADYEGEVQWSAELGYGTRAPEGGQSEQRDDAATGNKLVREVLEHHLLPEDMPVSSTGPGGSAQRVKLNLERGRRRLQRNHEARKAQRAAEKAKAKGEQA